MLELLNTRQLLINHRDIAYQKYYIFPYMVRECVYIRS